MKSAYIAIASLLLISTAQAADFRLTEKTTLTAGQVTGTSVLYIDGSHGVKGITPSVLFDAAGFGSGDSPTLAGLTLNGNLTGTGIGAFNTITAAAGATITGTLTNNGNFTSTGNALISGNITGSGNLLITGTNNLPQAGQVVPVEYSTTVTTGTGKGYFVVTPILDGKSITHANITTLVTGTTGTTGVQLVRIRSGTPANVLSTIVSIDSAELTSITAAVPYVIDTGNDDLATGDLLRVDISNVTTTAPTGLIFSFEAR